MARVCGRSDAEILGRVLAVGLLATLIAGCARYEPVTRGIDSGSRYTVQPGDTVGTIADRFGTDWRAIADANHLRNPDIIFVGQALSIPRGPSIGGTRGVEVALRDTVLVTTSNGGSVSTAGNTPVAAPSRNVGVTAPVPPKVIPSPTPRPDPPPSPGAQRTAAATPGAADGRNSGEPTADSPPAAAEAKQPGPPAHRPAPSPMPGGIQTAATRRGDRGPPPLSGDGFLWPVAGQVVDAFGDKPNGQRNDGINISAPAGAPIVAAENGVVVFAGDGITGFGNMLLVRHADGFTTAYAHAQKLEVGVGDVVRRGQVVARVGKTGTVATPQLHFEMRSGRTPLDPLRHLSGRSSVVASTG